MFLEVEMEEERCRWGSYNLNCKNHQKERIYKETNNK